MFLSIVHRDRIHRVKQILVVNFYVTRGYGSGVGGDSGSLGDTPSSAQSYSGSQVIVSTGRYISGDPPNTIGSGYIRMNESDPTTPYIDIIERTGSGIYDVSLKSRLGDLSGLSSGLLYGETNLGFGLFTENVFLQGGITITGTTGSITGKLFVDTSSSQKMIFGIGVDGGSNDGIFINETTIGTPMVYSKLEVLIIFNMIQVVISV